MTKYICNVCIFFFTTLLVAQKKEMRLSMQQAIDYAIKNNYNNKLALNNIKAAKKRKWETTTIGLPQINATLDYRNWLKQQVTLLPAAAFDNTQSTIDIVQNYFENIVRNDTEVVAPTNFIPLRFGTKQTVDASISLTQVIFDGSYLIGLQSAKTYLKISEQAKKKTELATREAVINAYGNVLVAQQTIKILEKNKNILIKNLNETQKIYNNGLTEQENVEQLQITLGNVESNLSNAKRMLIITHKMLNLALGNPIEKKIVLTDSLDKLISLNTDLNLLTKVFNVENHIDYKMAENDRESKRLLMKFEQSKALPSLAVFINYGANANEDSFNFFNSNQKWYNYSLFGISIKLPLFSSFEREAKTARAKIELESSEIRKDELTQKLYLEAEAAKSAYQLSIENYQTNQKNLALAERIEKKQQIKFFEGLSSSFDLLQAQNQLYSQQNLYMQSMLNVIAKKAKLETALNAPIK
ncbi:MAG: TolC family protein [Tenacibaculum sp.]